MNPKWTREEFFRDLYNDPTISEKLRSYLGHFLNIKRVKCFEFDSYSDMVDTLRDNGYEVIWGGYIEAGFALQNILTENRTKCIGYAMNHNELHLAFVSDKVELERK